MVQHQGCGTSTEHRCPELQRGDILYAYFNEGKAAVIGDNVYIGPNTCIVEDVCIGDNATIGAGSVVTKDIPSNATAAGNYAKVLNFNNPGRYIQNRYLE